MGGLGRTTLGAIGYFARLQAVVGAPASGAGVGLSSLGNSHDSGLAGIKVVPVNGLWYALPRETVKRGMTQPPPGRKGFSLRPRLLCFKRKVELKTGR